MGIFTLNRCLNRRVHVLVDRPLGSRHPERPDLIYPLNYGYLPGTLSGDGEGKLVVAREAGRYSAEQIRAPTEFQERFFKSELTT